MADPKITIRVEGSGLPGGGSDGQVLTRKDGKAAWGDAPKGFSGSWEDLTDKPFEKKTSTLVGTYETDFEGGDQIDFAESDLQVGSLAGIEAGIEYEVSYPSLPSNTMYAETAIGTAALSKYGHVFIRLSGTSDAYIELRYGYNGGHYTLVSSGTYAEKFSSGKKGIAIYTTDQIKRLSDEFLPSAVPVVQSAVVGQTIVVKAVDDAGKPTERECVDANVIQSSTEGSTKCFRLTVDDSGTITATEITD